MTDTISADEYRRMQAREMREAELQEHVRQLCNKLGCLYYHTWRSDRSPAGFPDCVIVTRDGRLIFAELKRQNADPTPAQQEWLDGLRAVGRNVATFAVASGVWESLIEVVVWRPSDWLDGTIERVLRGDIS